MPRNWYVAIAGVVMAWCAVAQDPDAERRAETFEARFERRFAEESAKLRERLKAEFRESGVREEPVAAERSRRRTAELEQRVAELEKQNAALKRELATVERERAARRRQVGRPAAAEPSPAEGVEVLRAKIADLRRRGAPEDLLKSLEAELEAAAKGEPSPERETVSVPVTPLTGSGKPPAPKPADRVFLGVVPGRVSSEWRKRNEVSDGVGVRVTEVVPDSPAAKAGLKADDVLLSIDGAGVNGEDDLRAKLKAAGGRVRVSFRRGGSTLESAVDLGVAPGDRPEDPEFRRLYDDTLKKVIEEGAPSLGTGAGAGHGGGR